MPLAALCMPETKRPTIYIHTSRSVDYFPSHSHAPLTPTIFPDGQIGFFCVCSSVDLDALMTVLDVAIWL